jgi:protein-L-isoaspartate(D-aspartate) O-methyltransferase
MSANEPNFSEMRLAMINSQLRPNSVDDPRLLVAIDSVAREDFVPEGRRATAYADAMIALPNGDRMNAPMVTARLIDALKLRGDERVLVAGDATGYATAVVRELCTEAVPAHAEGGDFDALLIDAAVPVVPAELAQRLREGARVASGLLDGRVTRLAQGVKRGGAVRLVAFGDAEIAILPETVPAPVFSF